MEEFRTAECSWATAITDVGDLADDDDIMPQYSQDNSTAPHVDLRPRIRLPRQHFRRRVVGRAATVRGVHPSWLELGAG